MAADRQTAIYLDPPAGRVVIAMPPIWLRPLARITALVRPQP
jgi:hypothetical protein